MLQTQHLLRSNFPICLSPPQTHSLFPPNLSSSPLNFLYKPINHCSFSARSSPRPEQWLAEVPEPSTGTGTYTVPDEEGPIEILDTDSPVFATTDDPSFIQTATSVLLTGAIAVFLFRSLRRRAKRAKELVKIIAFSSFHLCMKITVFSVLLLYSLEFYELGFGWITLFFSIIIFYALL